MLTTFHETQENYDPKQFRQEMLEKEKVRRHMERISHPYQNVQKELNEIKNIQEKLKKQPKERKTGTIIDVPKYTSYSFSKFAHEKELKSEMNKAKICLEIRTEQRLIMDAKQAPSQNHSTISSSSISNS